jgi:hypothetical protein
MPISLKPPDIADSTSSSIVLLACPHMLVWM